MWPPWRLLQRVAWRRRPYLASISDVDRVACGAARERWSDCGPGESMRRLIAPRSTPLLSEAKRLGTDWYESLTGRSRASIRPVRDVLAPIGGLLPDRPEEFHPGRREVTVSAHAGPAEEKLTDFVPAVSNLLSVIFRSLSAHQPPRRFGN